ncbi:MAG TPA: glyoxalase superfamily protein, partial [Hyphomicrobiaceae bacterium]|nr:glyoxalase superfamily protein [Hyphomicrobiaceae bacterium]
MAGMKDATMYSTMDGAKKRAKQLKHILERSGLAYSLAKCQAAVARAAGYEDWHDLTRRISQRTNTHFPYDYWGELIRNLPDPCHLPVRSHLRCEFASEPSDDASRKCWLRDTLPYLVSLEVVHRTTTQ